MFTVPIKKKKEPNLPHLTQAVVAIRQFTNIPEINGSIHYIRAILTSPESVNRPFTCKQVKNHHSTVEMVSVKICEVTAYGRASWIGRQWVPHPNHILA